MKKASRLSTKKNVRQILLTVAEVMFEMVALIFQRIECFVFNFPAGATGLDQLNDVLPAHRLVAYPAVIIGHFLIHFEPILKKIDLIGIAGAV